MGSQLEQSASHNVLTPSSQKSPKVAMVQPQPHIGNKKPVARVLPSLKTPVKSIASQEEASSAREEVKDDNKEKEAVAFGPPLPADLLSESALSSQAPIGGVGSDLVKFSLKNTGKKNYRWSSHCLDHTSESEEKDGRIKSKKRDKRRANSSSSPFSNSSEGEEGKRAKHRRKRCSSSSEYEIDSKARKRDRHEQTSKKRDHTRKKKHRSHSTHDQHHKSDYYSSRSDSDHISRARFSKEKARTSDSGREESTECEESRSGSHEHRRTEKSKIDSNHFKKTG